MACKSTGAKDFYVEAIAAGLAEYGKYDAAANLESRFIGALISEDAKKKAKVRLDLYLSHKPCRDVEFYHIF